MEKMFFKIDENNLLYTNRNKSINIRIGDIIRIIPSKRFPNCEREIKIDEFLKEGFLYGLSTHCDGYVIPYYWIEDLKVIK